MNTGEESNKKIRFTAIDLKAMKRRIYENRNRGNYKTTAVTNKSILIVQERHCDRLLHERHIDDLEQDNKTNADVTDKQKTIYNKRNDTKILSRRTFTVLCAILQNPISGNWNKKQRMSMKLWRTCKKNHGYI